MILIDSFGWIEYFTDGPLADKFANYVEAVSPANTFAPTIVIYEVYKVIKREAGEDKALEAYAQLKNTKIIPLDENLSLSVADISLEFGMPLADSVIYATAKRFGAKIITSDPHFEGKNGVMFITK
ncbi:MAG: type II toxin-antitoxin system VapC family toxin [Candidatus Heimdallarchaeota archaeon]